MTHFLRRSISLLSRSVVYCIQSEFDLSWTKKPFSSPAPIKHWAKKTPPLLLPSLLQYFLSSAFRYIGLERETGKKGRKKRHVLSTDVQCHLQLVQEKHGCIARERTDIFQGKNHPCPPAPNGTEARESARLQNYGESNLVPNFAW